MTMINLREYYPNSYTTVCFIAVPDEIAETLRRFKLEDEAYRIRTYRNKAYFSLDYGENIEREAVFLVMTPADIWEQKELNRRLYKKRNIWDADTIRLALDQCEDSKLYIAMNLSFACSLRMGEILGLTWQNVHIEDEDIAADNAYIYIDKELTRASK